MTLNQINEQIRQRYQIISSTWWLKVHGVHAAKSNIAFECTDNTLLNMIAWSIQVIWAEYEVI